VDERSLWPQFFLDLHRFQGQLSAKPEQDACAQLAKSFGRVKNKLLATADDSDVLASIKEYTGGLPLDTTIYRGMGQGIAAITRLADAHDLWADVFERARSRLNTSAAEPDLSWAQQSLRSAALLHGGTAPAPRGTTMKPTSKVPQELKIAWRKFCEDVRCQVVVRVREQRQREIVKLLSQNDVLSVSAWHSEVWALESMTLVDGERWPEPVSDRARSVESAHRLEDALARGVVELHGNYHWRPGTVRMAVQVKDLSDVDLATVIGDVCRVLRDDDRSPAEKADALKELPGLGIGTASGLVMLFHPREIAQLNSKSREFLERLGHPRDLDLDGYSALMGDLARGLGARDFLELDYFLYAWTQGYLDSPLAESSTSATTPITTRTARRMNPVNLILYGPPGTGKTYATMERAVNLCLDSPVDALSRGDIRREYERLRQAQRIEFVTFHQSYSYEEFVEGIRPVLESDDGGNVGYRCQEGLFRRICRQAERGRLSEASLRVENKRVWKMSLGKFASKEDVAVYERALEEGLLLLGYGGMVDYSGANDKQSVKERIAEHDPYDSTGYRAQAVHLFKNELMSGDLVVISAGNHAFRAIGEVTGDYRYLGSNVTRYAHARPVRWLTILDDPEPCDRITRVAFTQKTIYPISPSKIRWDALQDVVNQGVEDLDTGSPEPHVLIIDEINRGNISRILGELITLLEPTKRIGMPDELKVRLPYSRREFGVPANLHVIGTMNTADRSLAFLDSALRRRFTFEEVEPDPEVIRKVKGAGSVVEGIDLARLLQVLNLRIEALLDRDHRLGHSYFLQVSTLDGLRDVFRREIIPMLQEHFYDEREKVAAVLGCPRSHVNVTPLLRAREITDPVLADFGEQLPHYEVDRAFLSAQGEMLAAYFRGILSESAS
jgi:hypothetical protein